MIGFMLGFSFGLFLGIFFAFKSILEGSIKYDLVIDSDLRRTNLDRNGDPEIDVVN